MTARWLRSFRKVSLVPNVLRRSALLACIVLSIVVNLLGGAFSGVVHAHEHERAAVEHHDHERDVNHSTSDQQRGSLAADPQSDWADWDNVDGNRQLHEHHAEIVLITLQTESLAIDRLGLNWIRPETSRATGQGAVPGERPPCVV